MSETTYPPGLRPDAYGCVGGAPVDDEPACAECGAQVLYMGSRCVGCIEADHEDDDLDFERKTDLENAANDEAA